MYAVDKHPELAAVARSGFKDIDSLLSARELIIACDAIGGVRERAKHHRDLAVEALAAFPDSDSKTALVTLAYYLTEPNQNRCACAPAPRVLLAALNRSAKTRAETRP